MTRPLDASEKKGGRNTASIADPKLEDHFIQVISDHTAGDPMREDVTWAYLTPLEIARQLARVGTPVCPETVRGLLDDFGFSRRRPEKKKTMGQAEGRNEQFEIIADLKRAYFDSPNPIISMDTKKKELLGEFWRPGEAYGNGPNDIFDHDYPSFAEGKLVPHGLYDVRRNVGHLTLGLSHDTSQFRCDSLLLWWRRHGQRAEQQFPDWNYTVVPNAFQQIGKLFLGGSKIVQDQRYSPESLARKSSRIEKYPQLLRKRPN